MYLILAQVVISLFISYSKGETELPPDHALFVDRIQCVLDNLENEDCEQEEVNCEENEWEAEVFEPLPFQQCVQELCQEKTSNLGIALNQTALESETLKPDVRREFRQHLSKLFDGLKQIGDDALEKLKNDQDFKKKAKGYSWLISQMSDVVHAYSSTVGHGELPTSFEEFQKIMNGNFTNWDQNLLREIYNLQKSASEAFRASDEHNTFDQAVTSSDARRQTLGNLEQRIRNLPPEFPQKWGLFQSLHRIQAANQLSDQLSDSLYMEIFTLKQGLFFAETLVADPFSQALMETNSEKIRDTYKGYQIYENFSEDSEKSAFIWGCEHRIAQQAASLVSGEEKKRIKGLIQNARNVMIQRTKKKVSPKTHKKVKTYALGKEPSLPPSREEFLNLMKSSFQEKAIFQKALKNDFLASTPSISSLNPVQMTESLCTLPLNLTANASALTTGHSHDSFEETITMGSLTLKDFDQNGLWIYAHELGHVVSGIIDREGSFASQKDYRRSRECLASQQSGGDLNYLFKVITGDSLARGQKNEEDFADLFAFEFLPEVSSGPCVFFNEGVGFRREENFLQSPDLEKHSPGLYRLFHSQKYTDRELPTSCTKELATSPLKPKFKKCWKHGTQNFSKQNIQER